MKAKQCGHWMIDLDDLSCRNTENDLLIVFERRGSALQGKIKIMPMRLAQEWLNNPNFDTNMRQAVIEADEAFFKEYFANELNQKYIRKRRYSP